MASSMNKAIILGRLGKDPEVRSTQSGKTVASFSLATSEGRDNDKTEWHNIVTWEKTADIVSRYVHKGDLLLVEGRLQTRKWQDKQGIDHWTTEIVADRVTLMPNLRREEQHLDRSAPEPAGSGDGDGDDIPF